jgi:superfamily I DNA and/or RNA helicase
MISVITSISYDNYLFSKKNIIISALNNLVKNFKKFKIQSELIIVSNCRDNKKIFFNIKK